ncbi:MAG: cytochrome ubiquinol oxidase subunit I [Desulfurococcales archaeon]|nr:cytochrome ubiquinol oxidase subunit I [Desulfurococcales archaeon]
MEGVTIAVFWLAYVFSFHIILVNLGIYLGLMVPYLKYRAKKMGDNGLLRVSKNLMKFYAATYALAGVFATAFTVFLLSFYPFFLGLAGNIALAPFAIAILMIVLHFFSISSYYYGWDRFKESTHNFIGILLAISALLIPLGFRSVFAFLNTPVGLYFDVTSEGIVPRLDLTEALTNPTLYPLYLKSLVAAITVGALATGGYAAVKYFKAEDEEYKNALKLYTQKTVTIGLIGLIIMFFLGLWYTLSLRGVEYKFNNIFAPLGWSVGGGSAEFNVSWLFVLKMIFYIAQLVLVFQVYQAIKKAGFVNRGGANKLLYAGLLGIATIALGELLNAFSQYPYFVADVQSPPVEIPPQAAPYLLNVLNLANVNKLATLTGVQLLTVGFMVFLSLSAVWFLYVIFKEFEKEV